MKKIMYSCSFLKKEYTKFSLVLFLLLVFSSANFVNGQKQPLSQNTTDKLKAVYQKIKNPEISFQRFSEINAHVYAGQNRDAAVNAPQDTYCSKVRAFCANGDFESGLDQNQWTGAYGTDFTGILPNPFNLTYGFLSGALTLSTSRQTIVEKTAGNDPRVPIPQVAPNGGNRALRLGNAVNGNGTEVLAKTFVVDPNETILNFFYAVVFEDPNHSYNDQPAFSVRAYDCATGVELPNVCNLGNNSNVVVSDATNPFFQSANSGTLAYRNWSRAQINLSAHVGKTVIVIFETKDCNLSGHYGYAYLDNIFSSQCLPPGEDPTNQGSISLNIAASSTCGIGQICANYTFPTVGPITGSVNISLDIYQAGIKLTTITSGILTSGTSYCFNINPATLGLNAALGGFDYALTGNFALSGSSLASIVVGNPPNGQVSGANNDYLIVCPPPGDVYYSKSSGDLHNVLTWGRNPDGSGDNPPDFSAGKTFILANRPGIYTMTANWAVAGTIVNPAGSQLQINGFTLSEAALTGGGTLTGSLTSNLTVTGTTGGDAGTLNFTSGSANLNNLTLNRSGAAASATIGATPLSLYGQLNIINGTFNTNNALTLKSTSVNTASVAPIIGAISGTVTVERYIPARRAWRILAAPVGGSQTINAAWQEGATTASANPNPNPGFGTHITEGNPANGFDQNPLVAMMSAKTYISATNTWTPVANTNATAVNSDAFMLFVRGERGNTLGLNTVPATNTTLRATGPLKVGDQIFPVSATGFTAIPNPFASPINFATLTMPGVANTFYLWDPKVGGTNGVGAYVTVSFNGSTYDVSSNAISPESQYIQSGQGFLVYPITTGVAGSITIKESDKSNTAAADVFRMAGGNNSSTITAAPVFEDATKGQGLRLKLQTINDDRTTAVLDEVFASYKAAYSNKVDQWDAVKATNMGENLGMVRDGQTLVIERKALPAAGDRVELKLWNTEQKAYLLEINPVNLSAIGLVAYLEDKYLRTSVAVPLDKISQVHFTINRNAASAHADRFSIVFSKNNKLENVITKNSIIAYPNPVTGRSIGLQFSKELGSGTYLVTLINSSGRVMLERSVKYLSGSALQTLQLDRKLPTGVYKLQVKGKDTNETIQILSQ